MKAPFPMNLEHEDPSPLALSPSRRGDTAMRQFRGTMRVPRSWYSHPGRLPVRWGEGESGVERGYRFV